MHFRSMPMRLVAGLAGGVLVAGLITMAPAAVFAVAPTGDIVNVHVSQSDGTPLAGVDINYKCGTSTIDWGVTDSGGGVHGRLPDGSTCTFIATYRGTSDDTTLIIASSPTNVFFQTSAVTVTLADHSGGPLGGGVASYKAPATTGSTYFLNATSAASTTDALTGAVTGQLFDGTYDFRMVYGPGSDWKDNVPVSGATTVPFQTGLLSIVYSNALSYGGTLGNSAFFTKTGTELLPGTYNFHPRSVGYNPAGSGCQPITIDAPAAGATATKTILAAQLIDSAGNPLADGTFDYYAAGWHTSVGTTDSSGAACVVVDGALGSNTYARMHYAGTSQQIGPQDAATNSVFNFQTTDVTVQLENHLGNLIDTGTASYFAVSWHTIGATSGGQVHVKMLPGSYSFRMAYNGRSQDLNAVAISNSPTTVTFQTALVNLHFSGTTQYIANGVWAPFSNPSEMLPVATTYGFSGTGHPRQQLTFTPTAGTVLEKTIAYLTVLESNGTTGVPGVTFVWQIFGSPPDQAVPGSTNAQGVLLHVMDGYNNTATRYVPTYLGGTGPRMDPLPATQSFVTWQLINVTVNLTDVNSALTGNPLVTYEYPGGGRHVFGTLSNGTASLEMMPTSGYVAFYIDNFNNTNARINASPMNTNNYVVNFEAGRIVDTAGYLNHWRISGGTNTSAGNAIGYHVDVLPNTAFYFYPTAGESPAGADRHRCRPDAHVHGPRWDLHHYSVTNHRIRWVQRPSAC